MRLRECPPKMHSRRINPLRKHGVEEPFDKCTSEYYSCGRKGLHGKKFVHELVSQSPSDSLYIANDHDRDDGCGRSSSDLDSEGSELLCADADGKMYPCESPYSSQEESFLHRSIDHAGFSSDKGPSEQEMKWEVSISPLSSSPARGGHRRTFPPPLSSVATQSYCDKLGQSPGACSTGSCLRSIRCNGRFVLQEVKAPTHKYLLVSRGDGRLKLELVSAENDTSAEEDEASASDACVGVDNCDSIGEMETEMACTSKVCGEDICVESMQASMLYAKSTCVAFSRTEKLMPEESRAGIRTEGCEKAMDMVDKLAIVAEKGKPLVCVVPEALSMPGTMSMASESPSSPRCIEIRACYSGPSPRMKRSWIRPIWAC
ncbi:hypothetical protein L7F22_027429 [Adiantum nelumboides]|nr:hypothetical protein [Adiantum nelumboides]